MKQSQNYAPTAALTTALTEAEQIKFQEHLWQLLKEQTALFTKGESASVPVELGEELLESIVFTLKEAMIIGGISPNQLHNADLKAALSTGQQSLRYRLFAGRNLWQRACRTAPKIEQISYSATLKSIGKFFSAYDPNLFAHQIPCDIDYQLCLPVDERLKGILYINAYLLRIIRENRMVNAFSAEKVISLAERISPQYRELLLNLCEPLLTNAVGRILLDKEPFDLNITAEDRDALSRTLQGRSLNELAVLNDIALRSLCREAGFHDEDDNSYFSAVVSNLTPRLSAALNNDDLSDVFLTIE